MLPLSLSCPPYLYCPVLMLVLCIAYILPITPLLMVQFLLVSLPRRLAEGYCRISYIFIAPCQPPLVGVSSCSSGSHSHSIGCCIAHWLVVSSGCILVKRPCPENLAFSSSIFFRFAFLILSFFVVLANCLSASYQYAWSIYSIVLSIGYFCTNSGQYMLAITCKFSANSLNLFFSSTLHCLLYELLVTTLATQSIILYLGLSSYRPVSQ